MARNKYPEQTVERILDVSTRLFLEKGYDHTSLQDIINELDGLTKGAIYHHFKSKEDIFDAVATKVSQSNTDVLMKIKNDTNLSGAEKLKTLVKSSVYSQTTKTLIEMTPNLLENPKFLAMQLKCSCYEVVPDFILPIVQEGIADKTIETDKPYELAEMITLLINVWLNPTILGTDRERLPAKCSMLNEIAAQYKFTLFDEETIETIKTL